MGSYGDGAPRFWATLSLAFLSVWDRIRVVSQAREQASRNFPIFFSFYQVFFGAPLDGRGGLPYDAAGHDRQGAFRDNGLGVVTLLEAAA